MFWAIAIAGVIYLLFLAFVLAFFTSVKRMNQRWERAFRETHRERYDEHWRHTA